MQQLSDNTKKDPALQQMTLPILSGPHVYIRGFLNDHFSILCNVQASQHIEPCLILNQHLLLKQMHHKHISDFLCHNIK